MSGDPINRGVWAKNYPEDALKIECPRMTAYQFVKVRNRNNLNSTAFDYHGTQLKYGRFFEKIDETANLYASIGVKKGDIVTILSAAFPESIFTMYALNKMGAVCNFIDPRLAPDRILQVIAKSGCKVMLALDLVYYKLDGLFEKTGVETLIVHNPSDSLPFYKRWLFRLKSQKKDIKFDGRTMSWKNFETTPITKKAEEAEFVPDTPAIVVQTGGTTGTPKGVILSSEAINSAALGMQYAEYDTDYSGQTFINLMPMFSSYGIVCGLHVPFIMGVKDIIVPDFKPDKFTYLVHKHKPNNMIAVPAYYEKLMFDKLTKDDDYSHVKSWASGGDTMTLPLEKKLEEFFLSHGSKYTIVQGYGMSEIASVATFGCFHKCKHGSVGYPTILNEIRIFKEGTDEEVPIGTEGEICISGSTIMLGYFDEPEETAHVLKTHSDGRKWVHSGDIGHMDEDGFIFISGRLKRMITRYDGHKNFPVQVEKVAMSYPDVLNCSVIAVKDVDHTLGYLPLIIAELKNYDCDREAVRKGILELCSKYLEERSQPVDVVFVEKIPLTSVGKNDISRLANEYGEYKYK